MPNNTRIRDGHASWRMERDDDGYKDYYVTHKVWSTDLNDGPANVSEVVGLPQAGDTWFFGNDVDTYAVCTPYLRVTEIDATENDGAVGWFLVEQKFTTRPSTKCFQNYGTGTGNVADDPLLLPDRISGSFQKYLDEATYDRFGDAINNSAHEQIRGPGVEFDQNRPSVRIAQNVGNLEFELLCELIDCVNDVAMWGFPERSVKLSNVTWEEKYTAGCVAYYERIMEFDIYTKLDPVTGDLVSGFDRDLVDEGTKVLHGHWDETTDGKWVIDPIGFFAHITPDPDNPTHFDRYVDRFGNMTRVILNGAGLPAYARIGTGTHTTDAGNIHVEKYYSADLSGNLGLPATIPP